MANLLIRLLVMSSLVGLTIPAQSQNAIPETGVKARLPLVVTLRGSPYERGRIHGQTLRVEITELARKWKDDLAAAAGVDADTFIALFLRETDFITAARRWTPDLLEEVRGIADGAGIPHDTALAMQMLDELWTYVGQHRDANQCSAIGVARTADRPTYIAQNMDIEKFRDGYQVVLRVERDKGGPAQLIFTCAGLVALNGVNERSIGVVVNTLAQLRQAPQGLPVAFVVRGLLARTSERDAVRFLTSVPHASGQNYIIGTRTSVVDYEASAGKVVRFVPPDAAVVYHTNHALANDDFAAAGLGPSENSAMRLKSLNERLRMPGDRPSLSTIAHTLRSRDSEHAVCRRIDDRGAVFTFGSTLMTLSDKPTLQVAPGPPDQHEYVSFGFDRARR